MIKGAVSRVTLVKLTYLLGLACCICVSGQTFRTQKLFRMEYRGVCVWVNIGVMERRHACQA